MINFIARFLRSQNARLLNGNSKVVQKTLKGFYALSILFHKVKWGNKNGFIVIDNFDGDLKLKVNRSWVMGFSIYWSGYHEYREFVFLNKFLKPEMVFVDIGANLGEYSMFAAKRLTQGRVLAFEPLPKMWKLLEENAHLNNFTNINIYKYGLSDREAVLPIHEIEDLHEGLTTLFPGERTTRNVTEVPLKSFDTEVEKYAINRIDFIKCDIEGGELFALRGAQKSIEKFRPVVMVELNALTYASAGYSVKDVHDFFESLSYKPFEIIGEGELSLTVQNSNFRNLVFKPS